MNKLFTYSILQYRHSLVTREAVNVGVLFAFFDENKLEFVFGNSYRVRSIYHDFDPSLFNSALKFIQDKVKSESDNLLFNETNLKDNFHQFINNKLLREDSTSLQFTEPISAFSINDRSTTVTNYSKLLLNGIDTKKQEVIRHNEAFLLRQYTSYVFENNRQIENKVKRNVSVNYNNINVKFDLSWQNGTLNLVKPISFDLKEQADIQNKSAQYFGYFTLLGDYAQKNNCRFDLLIAKPRERKLYNEYTKAIETLEKIDANKKIIKENDLKTYSEETRENLLKLE